MGHSAGDRLIVKFAGLLRSVFPEKDFVGRYGGKTSYDKKVDISKSKAYCGRRHCNKRFAQNVLRDNKEARRWKI